MVKRFLLVGSLVLFTGRGQAAEAVGAISAGLHKPPRASVTEAKPIDKCNAIW